MHRNLNLPSGTSNVIGTPLVGVPGTEVPIVVAGSNGPGYGRDILVENPSEVSKYFKGVITRFPLVGKLVANEDTSATYTRDDDGVEYFEFQPYTNNVPFGPVRRVNLVVGEVVQAGQRTFLMRNINLMRLAGF